jgi:transcriptional regulator with XRE-family HTH domain
MTKRIYPNLAAFLADTGLSQAELAEKVGASQSVISRLVNRKLTRIDAALAERITRVARVPMESLYCDGGAR